MQASNNRRSPLPINSNASTSRRTPSSLVNKTSLVNNQVIPNFSQMSFSEISEVIAGIIEKQKSIDTINRRVEHLEKKIADEKEKNNERFEKLIRSNRSFLNDINLINKKLDNLILRKLHENTDIKEFMRNDKRETLLMDDNLQNVNSRNHHYLLTKKNRLANALTNLLKSREIANLNDRQQKSEKRVDYLEHVLRALNEKLIGQDEMRRTNVSVFRRNGDFVNPNASQSNSIQQTRNRHPSFSTVSKSSTEKAYQTKLENPSDLMNKVKKLEELEKDFFVANPRFNYQLNLLKGKVNQLIRMQRDNFSIQDQLTFLRDEFNSLQKEIKDFKLAPKATTFPTSIRMPIKSDYELINDKELPRIPGSTNSIRSNVSNSTRNRAISTTDNLALKTNLHNRNRTISGNLSLPAVHLSNNTSATQLQAKSSNNSSQRLGNWSNTSINKSSPNSCSQRSEIKKSSELSTLGRLLTPEAMRNKIKTEKPFKGGIDFIRESKLEAGFLNFYDDLYRRKTPEPMKKIQTQNSTSLPISMSSSLQRSDRIKRESHQKSLSEESKRNGNYFASSSKESFPNTASSLHSSTRKVNQFEYDDHQFTETSQSNYSQ